MISFQAYCFRCERTVIALPILTDVEFWSALNADADVEVMHIASDGDHRWNLIKQEKKNLRIERAKGLL
jgi:hypothetical protein